MFPVLILVPAVFLCSPGEVSLMVYIIGIGPGDPELLTVKAMRILEKADYVLYVSGLYIDGVLQYCNPEAKVLLIKNFGIGSQLDFIKEHPDSVIVRLHTGDLAFESGCRDFLDLLAANKIGYKCIPGVSSVAAGLSELASDTLLPGISNSFTVVKPFGFPFVSEGHSVKDSAGKGRGVAVFGICPATIQSVVDELYEAGCFHNTMVCLASRVSLPGQKMVVLPLCRVADKVCSDKSFWRFTLLYVGSFLGAKTIYSPDRGRILPADVIVEDLG